MDDCKQIFALLSEYLDADLPTGTCREIEAHIANCPPCVEFVRSLRHSVKLCHGHQLTDGPARKNPEDREALLAAYRKMLASAPRFS